MFDDSKRYWEANTLKNQGISIHIECGEKGIGKTTYVKQQWNRYLFIACGDPLNQIKSSGALFFALADIDETITDDLWDIVKHLRKAIQNGYALIIDEAEHIDEALLKIIINTALVNPDSKIIFTFDLDCKYLYTSKIFRQLIQWDIISLEAIANFCADKKEFSRLIMEYIPTASGPLMNELIQTANYNFNNLKRLLWLIINKQTDFIRIKEDVIEEYSYFLVEEKLSDLPNDLIDILKKSSVIGKMFQSSILESPYGFHVLGVKAYLNKLEATNLFIQSYLQEDVYQFISNRIYTGVLKSLEPHEKIESQRILIHYYMTKLAVDRKNDTILEYLQQLKRLSYDLNDYDIMFFVEKKLLFRYLKIGDIVKAKETLEDLLAFCKEHIEDNMLFLFLSYYKIQLDMNTSNFKDALDGISVVERDFSNGGNHYLQYYYARSLYGVGDVDQSYAEAIRLGAELKTTSSKAAENQSIYALTYSLLATIQHHFGIEDYGSRYYMLALNHSKQKLKDKSIYFDILRKCDMYYAFEHSCPLLIQCISYYESMGKRYDAAEVYVNLATEMMFNNTNLASKSANYLEKAIEIFSDMPNENFVYAQNNRAILKIIQHGDFRAAALQLEKSLLVGLSAFTYMTLYLNLCMCYLILYGYESHKLNFTYKEFCKYYEIIKNRENATQYEDMYKTILDILILEYKGSRQVVIDRTVQLLDDSTSQFFIPILEDIKRRNSPNRQIENSYSHNDVLYRIFNRYKVFFAEFRFWE